MALEKAQAVRLLLNGETIDRFDVPVLIVTTTAKDNQDKSFPVKYLTLTIPLDENANS